MARRKYVVRPYETPDAAYRRMAGEAGLFCVAFFDHTLATPRETRNARRRLEYMWQRILDQVWGPL